MEIEKGGDGRPLFLSASEVSLAFLAGLLLPALGFLRHCLLSPPSFGFGLVCESASDLLRPAVRQVISRRLAHRALAFAPERNSMRLTLPRWSIFSSFTMAG